MSTSTRNISLPDTRPEDRLDDDLIVQLPFGELRFPDLPAEAVAATSSPDADPSDSDSEDEASPAPNCEGFLGSRPSWSSGSAEKITAYAASRHKQQTWALFGRADGSLDLHCSPSRFQKPTNHLASPPRSPDALHYPDSNLLTTRLIGRKGHRSASAASSVRSYGPAGRHKRSNSPEGSLRSSSSHTDLTSRLGRKPRKASATLSISGLEAITSAPQSSSPGPQASAILQAPAIIEPSPTSPPDTHVLLSKLSLQNRDSIQDTWQEEAQDIESNAPSLGSPRFTNATDTPSFEPDLDWAEPLQHLAHISPPENASFGRLDQPSQIRLVLSDDRFSHVGVVMTQKGRLYRVSLRDGRFKDLGLAADKKDDVVNAFHIVPLATGTLVLVFQRSGIVRALNLRTGQELQRIETGLVNPLVTAQSTPAEAETSLNQQTFLLAGKDSLQTKRLTATLLPPNDVGPSVLAPNQVELSIQDLGEITLATKPIDISFADENLIVLCERSVHVLSLVPQSLNNLYAVDIKAGAQSILVFQDSNVVIVAYSDQLSAYRLLLDDPAKAEMIPLWSVDTTDCGLLPSFFSPGHVAWLSSIHCSQAKLLACTSAAETTPDIVELTKPPQSTRPEAKVSSALVVDNETVALGYRNGNLALASLAALSPGANDPRISVAKWSFGMPIESVWRFDIESQKMLLATSTSGQIGLWQQEDLTRINLWSMFTTPLSKVAIAALSPEPTLVLVALDGTTAMVPVHSSGSIKLMIPATRESVQNIHLNDTWIMLQYASGHAREYDIPSGELRQSLAPEAVQKTLSEPGWSTLTFNMESSSPGRLKLRLRSVVSSLANLDSWATGPHSEHEDTIGANLGKLVAPRLLLSHLFTSDLSKTTRALTKSSFVLPRKSDRWPQSFILPADDDAYSALYLPTPTSAWSISRHTTTFRLACLVTLVRLFLNYTETQRDADELIVYYSTFLSERVGESFEPPSLDLLADLWFDPSSFICDSIQLLLGSVVSTMSEEKQIAEVERWHRLLPISNEHDLNPTQKKALLISGLVAVEAYKSIPAVTLRDISNLISNILNTEDGKKHRDLQRIAVELCARGFEWIQRYVDAVSLVKSLFGLATGKDEETPADLRSAASKAILQVAATNVQLFMATMAFDVLHTTSVNHRNATMRLVIFMVRRKPSVMHHSLPKLCEAIVHTLDPKDSSLRSTMQQTTTIIIGELVRTYPSVAFDRNTQKLACGTSEGAVLIYDLKTATRLFVLESHSASADAVSFSPDGRRLVSMSLAESNVAVWKVGSSILGLLQPGKPPRQNAAGFGPYKRINFTLGDSSAMSLQSILEWVRFDWQGDRTVSLRIRDASFTFAVA